MADLKYMIQPPPQTDQMEDQLILSVVSKRQSSLDGSFYTFVYGMYVEDGELVEIELDTSTRSPSALGRAIESLVIKME